MIRCDRTTPSCVKCMNRSIEYSGYGRNLRWINALAVRGRLKGLQYPKDASQDVVSSGGLSKSSWTEAAAKIAKMAPGAPNASEIEYLVSYYSRRIAGNMIWVDSPLNPYRRLVVPKARSSPIILLAILAVSAEHMASAPSPLTTFAPKARDVETAEWILAAMLILSNYECIGDTSTAWYSHRLGACLFINGFSDSSAESSELFRFLRAQFSIHDVFASTTTCLYLGTDDVVLPRLGDLEALLSEYIRLIHQITLYSTDINTAAHRVPTPAALRIEFERTRGLTLMSAATSAALGDESTRLNFIHLVDVHHIAALLYAYRCVYHFTPADAVMFLTMQELFEKLENCANIGALIQHLMWPVFIAGTEYHGSRDKQCLVLKWYRDIIKKTGFRNYEIVTSFLEDLWKKEPECWLENAKAWDGKPLLAV
ncbi:fungal-specific transcription factor domain-containing protein [Xylogone sp. PMI_703]|nr:fungal-specific transcription factor domain-containing protein [Xylogone sp. PMI_703]